jgi:hypothetical protein
MMRLPLVFLALACAVVPALAGHVAAQELDLRELAGRVEQTRVSAHIDAIAQPRNGFEQPQALRDTADYVEEQLAEQGLDVVRDDVSYRGVRFPNVTGVLPGTQCPERILIVGSHYDSVEETPGADDNASGVAAMLEIARVLSEAPLPVTVWFASFTLEEEGLIGSQQMAAEAARDGAEIVGMMSMDGIAYTDPATGAEFILVLGNERSAPMISAVERIKPVVPDLPIVTLFAAGNGETSPDTRRSDHAPFWDAGYQALLVSDTANFRSPHYHEPSDTLETLDLPFTTNVARAMLATSAEYTTRDEDGDGRADVCTDSLAATATPQSSTTAQPAATATSPMQATATSQGGVRPPDTGGGDSDDVAGGHAMHVVQATAVLIGLLGAAQLWRLLRTRFGR